MNITENVRGADDGPSPAYPSDWKGMLDFSTPLCRSIEGREERPSGFPLAAEEVGTSLPTKPLFNFG